MTGDYMPFTHYDQATSQFTGFDVDMAEALGKALGVKVAFVKTSWPTLKKDFEADAFDVAMGGVSITLDRQKVGLFSDPVLREGKTPIARCADKDRFRLSPISTSPARASSSIRAAPTNGSPASTSRAPAFRSTTTT